MDHKSKIVFFSTPGNTSRITADLLDAIEKVEGVLVVKHIAMGKSESTRCVDVAAKHIVAQPLNLDHPSWYGSGKQQAQWKREQGPQRGKRGRR